MWMVIEVVVTTGVGCQASIEAKREARPNKKTPKELTHHAGFFCSFPFGFQAS
jgi:hypothetical protein